MQASKARDIDGKVGSLTPGKEADIIILDATRINVVPLNQVPGAVVSLMDRTNVETVIVAGKIRKVEEKLARRQSAAAGPTTRGIARLHFRRGRNSPEPVQQSVRCWSATRCGAAAAAPRGRLSVPASGRISWSGDKSAREDGTLSRSDFRCDGWRGIYICPNKRLRSKPGGQKAEEVSPSSI
jgi:hypothetical protein